MCWDLLSFTVVFRWTLYFITQQGGISGLFVAFFFFSSSLSLDRLCLLLDLLQVHLQPPDVRLELEVLNVQAIVNLLDLGLELCKLFYGRGLGAQRLELSFDGLDLLGIVADLIFCANMVQSAKRNTR